MRSPTLCFIASSLSVASASMAQFCHRWMEVRPLASPPARLGHVMVFDEARGVTVMVGGGDFMNTLDRTWVYDGASWLAVAQGLPAPVGDSAMVFDSHRGVAVLYGGRRESIPRRETWEWNGQSWIRRTGVGDVTTLESHAMTYDSTGGVTVLFGGWDGEEVFGQTWEYDGAHWAWRKPAVEPPARQLHAMAYDSRRGVTVLYGGLDDSIRTLADTWEWDGKEWSLRDANGAPRPHFRHRLVYNEALGATMLFGGGNTGIGSQNRVWLWDGVSWRELNTGPLRPERRNSHGMTYDSTRQRVVVFGGRDTGGAPLGDTWEFGLYPDCDQSTGAGSLDIFDFLCFQNMYAVNDTYACDCDIATGPGLCDIFDFLCFQNLFGNCAR